MILVCYDGSADAQAAIDQAAQTMPGTKATILTVWEPFAVAMARSGTVGMSQGWAGAYGDSGEADAALSQRAQDSAAEGARRAVAAGLVAEPRVVSQSDGTADAILRVAADVCAQVVVLGTRGRGGMKSFLLGSVSHEVVQHADRPVLIVPSAGLIEQRGGWLRGAE